MTAAAATAQAAAVVAAAAATRIAAVTSLVQADAENVASGLKNDEELAAAAGTAAGATGTVDEQ